MTRTRKLIAALLVAVAVVIAVVAVRSGGDDDGGATIGAQYPTPAGLARSEQYVLLPFGRLDFTYDPDPHDRPLDDGRDVAPPEDGRFVYVSWGPDYSESVPTAYTEPGPHRPVTITLLAAGRRVPLRVDGMSAVGDLGPRPAVPSGATYVAVPGNGEHAAVEVGYDGVVQRLDLVTGARTAGRAAGLYPVGAAVPDASCDDARLSPGFTLGEDAGCKFGAEPTAYVEGLGWAPAGRAWLLLSVTADLPIVVSRGRAIYDVDYRSGSAYLRYGRTKPIPAGDQGPPTGDAGRLEALNPRLFGVVPVAARGPLAKVTIVARTSAHLSDESPGAGPARLPIALTWTLLSD